MYRDQNSVPSAAVRQPALSRLIHNNDKEILVDAFWTVSYLTDEPNEGIQEVIDSFFVALPPSSPWPSSRPSCGQSATSSHTRSWVRGSCRGRQLQIQALISNNVIRPLDVLAKGDFKCQKEAAWAITNITWVLGIFWNVHLKHNCFFKIESIVEHIAMLFQFEGIAPFCSFVSCWTSRN